ncbi:hypothetical protein C3L33_13443, partial [Rhododendron williamsianum]
MNSPTSATGITRQGSNAKTNNCLCSPTTHAGSFRCRLHRVPPALQRTKSIDSRSLKDSRSKANMSAAETTNTGNTVEAHFALLRYNMVLVPEVMALPYGVETSRLGVMDFHDLCCFVSSIRLGKIHSALRDRLAHGIDKTEGGHRYAIYGNPLLVVLLFP